jgi:hypothetical protein
MYVPYEGKIMVHHSDKLSEPLKRTNIYLSEEDRAALIAEGKKLDISMAEIVRRCVASHIRNAARK